MDELDLFVEDQLRHQLSGARIRVAFCISGRRPRAGLSNELRPHRIGCGFPARHQSQPATGRASRRSAEPRKILVG